MKEKWKTAVLAVLVAASLVQSYVLAYGTPKFEALLPTEYVPTELAGTKAELADLVYPDKILLHFGDDKHTVLGPHRNFYRMIFNDFIQLRRFENFTKLDGFDMGLDWYQIRREHAGIEIRFKDGLAFSVLQSLLQIRSDGEAENDFIDRIWLYDPGDTNETKAYFFSSTGDTVYEAKADVRPAEIREKVALGEYLTGYTTTDGEIYVPLKDQTTVRYRFPYTQFTADQWKHNLFIDPNIAKSLQDREGSQIYTDGKRGLQIKTGQHWLVYSDPIAAPADGKTDPADTLSAAIQFINQHGGWNGRYLLSSLTPKEQDGNGTLTLEFRQYLNNFPIDDLPVLSTDNTFFGSMVITLQNGIVSHYERSMINLTEEGAVKTETSLAGGVPLMDRLSRYKRRSEVVDLFPAYKPAITDKSVEFVPQWAVELRDGSCEFLP